MRGIFHSVKEFIRCKVMPRHAFSIYHDLVSGYFPNREATGFLNPAGMLALIAKAPRNPPEGFAPFFGSVYVNFLQDL